MSIWHIDVVTGLLQADYARHHRQLQPGEPIPPLIRRLVRVRMRHQRVLSREGLQLRWC
jgi:hypothetical protein